MKHIELLSEDIERKRDTIIRISEKYGSMQKHASRNTNLPSCYAAVWKRRASL